MRDGSKSYWGWRTSLDQIVPDEVVAITNSLPGAMGESGLFEIYSIHEGRVLKFEGNWYHKLDVQEVNQHLPESAKIDAESLILGSDESWSIFGGGMGNVFIIRNEYYPELNDRCLLEPMRYYRDRISVMEQLLLEIASGFIPQKVSQEEIADELIQFVLQDFTENKEQNDKVTAVLWCDVYRLGDHWCHVKNGEIVKGICEGWKQNEIDGKYDKTHIRINFGNKHAVIRRIDAPDQRTVMVYDILVNPEYDPNSGEKQFSFANGRPLTFSERQLRRRYRR